MSFKEIMREVGVAGQLRLRAALAEDLRSVPVPCTSSQPSVTPTPDLLSTVHALTN